MNLRSHVFGGVAGLWMFCGATAVSGQAPRHTVALDFDCLAASLGPLQQIDFERLPLDASSCSDPPLANPLEISGVEFTDPVCLTTRFCSVHTCLLDPESRAPGNLLLMLNPEGAINFPPGTGSAVLDVQRIGSNPFRLRATDVLGLSAEVAASGEPFGAIFVAFTSPVGLSLIEIVEISGGNGPLGLAAVSWGPTLREAPDCPDRPPPDLGHLRPKATGTIRFFPELGILDPAPVDSPIQASYFRTTTDNREFRRGFIEFAVPEVEDEILAAALIISESRMAFIPQPMPTDLYEISYYAADLAVTTDDFGRSKILLDTFETDINQPPVELAFAITSQVREFRGRNLGFEIKLALDPLEEGNGFRGWSGFGSLSEGMPFLEIITQQLFYRRGDASADGRVDLSDPITILQALFGGADGAGLPCKKSADVDDTGVLDLTDAVYLLQFQFLGGPAPKAPFPSCGSDATPDDLGCAAVPPCL